MFEQASPKGFVVETRKKRIQLLHKLKLVYV